MILLGVGAVAHRATWKLSEVNPRRGIIDRPPFHLFGMGYLGAQIIVQGLVKRPVQGVAIHRNQPG